MEQDALRETIGRLRRDSGLSAKGLSERLRAHPTFVSRIERGYRTVDVVEFLDVVEALGLDPRDAFDAFLRRVAEVRGG